MKAIGIILAGGNNNRMKELTAKRAVPALPVAGSFRAIDRFFTQQHVKLTYTDSCDIDTI